MNPEHRQSGYRFRFDWGTAGADAVVPGSDVAIVVDVLSFTTTTTVAVEAGAAVYPFPWDPQAAAGYADERDAVAAVGRSVAGPGQVSLSPASVRGAGDVRRLVLPSPNGSALSFALADAGVPVVAACLRNASAVARWVAGRCGVVAVVAAGEQWPDGSRRPAVEDLLGAGAVLRALAVTDLSGCSPEARAAVSAFEGELPSLWQNLLDSASGRELAAKGFAGDVDIAAELDCSTAVPVLRGDAFVDGTETR